MIERQFINGVHRYELTDVDGILEKRISKYRDYKKQFDLAASMKCQSHPMYIVLELNNYCNMRCKMCRHSLDESTNGTDDMPMETFRKIIRDANDLGIPSLFLGGETECTISPNIHNFIRICREEGNQIDNVIITNGYELNEELGNLLIDLQWEKLYVSLDAATSVTYKRIRGRDLSRVEDNLNRIISLKKSKNSELPIIRVSFCMMPENMEEREMFFDKWKDKVEIIDYQKMAHFEDMRIRRNLPDTDRKCASPFNKLMIDCKGEIYPCCNEWSKYLSLGNINEITLEEAWNGDKINKLRREILSGRLCDICKNCLRSTEY